VDPSVTAVVITRRDPAGLAALLDAVLGQSLPPDAVVVLDRTAGAVLPAGAARRDGEVGTRDGKPGDPATAERLVTKECRVIGRRGRIHGRQALVR
jgi:hypothetical protein